jgi:hypothetical protein
VFAQPQASVQLFARALVVVPAELVATAHTATGSVVATVRVPSPSTWKPVALATPQGAAEITHVDIRAQGADIGVDDLAVSGSPQPDTVVLEAPEGRTESTVARFRFGANRQDVSGWRCSLDDAALTPCTSPVTYSGLAPGGHRFKVATVDSYGTIDPSPKEQAWTVLGPPPETPLSPTAQPVVSAGSVTLDFGGSPAVTYECSVDGGAFTPCVSPFTVSGLGPGPHTIEVRAVDADGRVDPTPARWTFDVPGVAGGVSVTDVDRDRIPDSEEVLPLGNVRPLAGVRTLATLVSGDVYVKLPSASRSFRQSGPLAGFVPLKGIAALPVGTIVDARRGTLALQTAVDGRVEGDARRRLGRARLTAAIFQIRQARARSAASRARRIATRLLLVSPPAAEIGCRRNPPAKGVVRTLRATAKGFYRVSGGGSFGQSRNATWQTTDRCDGTITRVTRGSVRVFDKGRRRTVTVRAGKRYIARATLFQARKGRRPA